MSDYLIQEDGSSKFGLEDATGFLLLETSPAIIITGRFDAPSPSGTSGEGMPDAGVFAPSPSGASGEGSPSAGVFDPASPGVTNA